MAQAVSHALATRKSGFDLRSVRVRIVVGGKEALTRGFFSQFSDFTAVSVTLMCVHVADTEGKTDEA